MLIVVLDGTIVTVALPSIVADLHLSGTSLTWLLNAYTLAYGGSLLLSGRFGDLYGQRRLFLKASAYSRLASVACDSHVRRRCCSSPGLQGIGGAVVTAVSLAIIHEPNFPDDRTCTSDGDYGFVCAAGGAVGEVLGGFITKSLTWHWIFFANLPVGIAVFAFCAVLLSSRHTTQGPRQLDVAGGVAIGYRVDTGCYALTNGTKRAGTSTRMLLGVSAVLLLLFLS